MTIDSPHQVCYPICVPGSTRVTRRKETGDADRLSPLDRTGNLEDPAFNVPATG
jgi:hypothetical protein